MLESCSQVTRYENNPVFSPKNVPYMSAQTFNAGVIRWKGEYLMVFRNDYDVRDGVHALATNIGLASSKDGIHWECKPEPVFEMRDEEISRAYDPRLTVIDGQPYMTFAIDTKHGIRGGIASTDDFQHFHLISATVPDNRNMVLFPEKINGMYYRLERPFPVYGNGMKDKFDVWISRSPDLVYWGESKLLCGVEDFPFANDKIGPGAPPVKTDRGWLIIGHAVDLDPTRGKNGWEPKWCKRYCATAMLVDLNDPTKVLGICKKPLLVPETPYETEDGFRTNVIFPTSAVVEDDGTCRIYYGAADTVIAMATAKVDDLVALCLENK